MYYNIKSDINLRKYAYINAASPSWTPSWITQNAQWCQWASFRFWFYTTSSTKISNNLVWGYFCKVKGKCLLGCWTSSWDNGDFVSTWVTSAVHGGCRRMACHKDCTGTDSLQLVHQWSASHNVQEIHLCRRYLPCPKARKFEVLNTTINTDIAKISELCKRGDCSLVWPKLCRALSTCTLFELTKIWT